MHVIPLVILDGMDVSRYFISCHCEMTANSTKDPGKYDLTLSNAGGRFLGMFALKNIEDVDREQMGLNDNPDPVNFHLAPKKKVSLKVTVSGKGCESGSRTITIFSGEIQKAEADELYVRIEGSCTEGGMTSKINPRTWDGSTPVKTVVEDLLKHFGLTDESKWHIYPKKNSLDDRKFELDKAIDFDVAMYTISQVAQSIYFFDENDDFWFVPAVELRGFSNLTGSVLRGAQAANMVGYANHVDVYGCTLEDLTTRTTHKLIYASADVRDDPLTEFEFGQYGLVRAPPICVPDADVRRCQVIADNMLSWYRQFKDVPSVKVVGKAPGLLSKVAYKPWNGAIPPVMCDGSEEAEMSEVLGLVTRRIVDISSEGGFVCTLDVATSFLAAGVSTGDEAEDIKNFYAMYQDALLDDPGVEAKIFGVTYV